MLHITAVGNLGKDPEIKFLEDGRAKARFSIAARTGKDEVTWLNCTVWEKAAHTVADYLRKGSRVTIVGKARIAKYETQNGEKRQSLEVTVNEFTLPPRQESQDAPNSDVPF